MIVKKLIPILCALLVALALWWNHHTPVGTATLDKVVIALEGNPITIDPPSVLDVHSSMIATVVHSPLMWVAPDRSLVPMVAKSLTMSDDALSLDIRLDANLTFWDGSKVTASDVIYSLERYRRSPHLHRWILDRIKGITDFDDKKENRISGITADSPDVVRIEFSSPEPDAALMLCNLSVSIVKSGTGELPTRPFGLQVIGCGPYSPGDFKPTSFTCRRRIANTSRPEELRFLVIPDDQARLESFRQGEASLVRLRGPMIGEAARVAEDRLTVSPAFSPGAVSVLQANEMTTLMINWSSPKLSSLDGIQRRAAHKLVLASLDRPQLVTSTQPVTCAEPTTSVAPPWLGGVGASNPFSAARDEDVKLPVLSLLAANDSASRQLAVAVQKQLAVRGIAFETEFVDLGKLVERLVSKQFDVLLLWIELQVPSSGPYAWCSFFDKNAPLSAFGEPRDDVGELLGSARGIANDQARADAFKKIIAMIDQRQQTWVPLMSRKAVMLHHPQVLPWFDINGTPVNGLIRTKL